MKKILFIFLFFVATLNIGNTTSYYKNDFGQNRKNDLGTSRCLDGYRVN